ncbi:effector-associated constant component EACC1 [Streptomyces tsukubensis]|uniref:Uncharacterized protein n=1 Tax=Streptomyces tsukubensis TaxID=83656 RepID=A0A1V4AAG6_9ACTN|nr:hypothetical protein [Streptomyces tsukubensis]OON80820.1 hypothetical protein B1H18_10515 [Streptomyces tsukubensis]QFR93540.1 hypothetical protein GBW32_11150 [Streptomyces tsukubensis]
MPSENPPSPLLIRVAVRPGDVAATPAAVEALRHWLLETGHVRGDDVRKVPRTGEESAPDVLSGEILYDLLVNFAASGAAASAAVLYRSVRSHLASQPDDDLRVTVTVEGEEGKSLQIRATGMSREELAELRRLVNDWMSPDQGE